MPMGMIAVDEKIVEQCDDAHRRLHVLHLQLPSTRLCDGRWRARHHGAREAGRARGDTSARGSARSSRKSSRGIRWWATSAARDFSGASSWCAIASAAFHIAPELKTASRVLSAAVKRGLFFYPSTGMAGPAGGDAMMITPPFIVDDNDIDFIVSTARAALDDVQPESALKMRVTSGMAESIIGPTSHYFFSQRLKLHYVDWGNPDAPLMILVHGGRDHCRNWDWTRARIAQALPRHRARPARSWRFRCMRSAVRTR